MEPDCPDLYKKMYYTLFSRISDALMALRVGNTEMATNILRIAQIEGEEQFMDNGHPPEEE